jgi:hypothetical protein
MAGTSACFLGVTDALDILASTAQQLVADGRCLRGGFAVEGKANPD